MGLLGSSRIFWNGAKIARYAGRRSSTQRVTRMCLYKPKMLLAIGLVLAVFIASVHAEPKKIRVFSAEDPSGERGVELVRVLEDAGGIEKNIVRWTGWSDTPQADHLVDTDVVIFLYNISEANGGLPYSSPFYSQLNNFVESGGLLITDATGGQIVVNIGNIFGQYFWDSMRIKTQLNHQLR